ncbi:hypothetical protein BDW67DRAFT_180125 [Aspergillus spinulosporus]
MERSPVYDRAKLGEYLNYIGYAENRACPQTGKLAQLERELEENPLAVLSELQARHIGKIPFGNTALHYSQHRTISLHSDTIFHKLVRRNLDGYCLESTGLFFNILKSLGFLVYATGARVSCAASGSGPENSFFGFGHMVVIVLIDKHAGQSEQYMVDVAFGPQYTTVPLRLLEDRVV